MLFGVSGMVGYLDHLRLVGQHGSGLSEGCSGTQKEQNDEYGFHGVLGDSARDNATPIPI